LGENCGHHISKEPQCPLFSENAIAWEKFTLNIYKSTSFCFCKSLGKTLLCCGQRKCQLLDYNMYAVQLTVF